jgi:hypothetical protein
MKPRRPFLDPNHPMFTKAWVRWACTLAPIAWGGFELWAGDPMWAVLFGAAGVYAGYTLIYKR